MAGRNRRRQRFDDVIVICPTNFSLSRKSRQAKACRTSERIKVIIAITNQKGGVGKTTTAINLAAAFARRGTRTLLLDLDPQGNSSISFLDPLKIDRSAYELMMDGQEPGDLPIYRSKVDNLDLVPARISLAKLESKLVG